MQLGEITGSLYDEEKHLCIGEGRDILPSSGHGLFVDDLERRWTIIGVMSVSGIWGGEWEDPGLISRVDKYLPWIRENM